MYAVLTTLSFGPGVWDTVAKTCDQTLAAVKGFSGFKRATFFGDNDSGKYNALIIWETKKDVDAAYAVLGPKLTQAIQGLGLPMKAPPTRQVFAVYEAKA